MPEATTSPDLARDLMRRAQEAGQRRLDELRDDGSFDAEVIDYVEDGAQRMWHAMGHPDWVASLTAPLTLIMQALLTLGVAH